MESKRTLIDYQKLIVETFDDWADFLGITHQWSIEIFYKKAKDFDEADDVATCVWPPSYRSASINFNKDYLLKKQPSFTEIRETVVHELGHLVNADLWDAINVNFNGQLRSTLTDQCEKAVDTWTRIVMRARGFEEDNGVVPVSEEVFRPEHEDRLRWVGY